MGNENNLDKLIRIAPKGTAPLARDLVLYVNQYDGDLSQCAREFEMTTGHLKMLLDGRKQMNEIAIPLLFRICKKIGVNPIEGLLKGEFLTLKEVNIGASCDIEKYFLRIQKYLSKDGGVDGCFSLAPEQYYERELLHVAIKEYVATHGEVISALRFRVSRDELEKLINGLHTVGCMSEVGRRRVAEVLGISYLHALLWSGKLQLGDLLPETNFDDVAVKYLKFVA